MTHKKSHEQKPRGQGQQGIGRSQNQHKQFISERTLKFQAQLNKKAKLI